MSITDRSPAEARTQNTSLCSTKVPSHRSSADPARRREEHHAPPTEYDLIVLGAGAVGENVADRAVQGGLTAVIVDELVGGECSYWACMPSKALLRSARYSAPRGSPRRRRGSDR